MSTFYYRGCLETSPLREIDFAIPKTNQIICGKARSSHFSTYRAVGDVSYCTCDTTYCNMGGITINDDSENAGKCLRLPYYYSTAVAITILMLAYIQWRIHSRYSRGGGGGSAGVPYQKNASNELGGGGVPLFPGSAIDITPSTNKVIRS